LLGQSTKSVCALIIIIGAIATSIAWMLDRSDATMWGVRIGAPVLALLALALIVKLNSRVDRAHDYLRERCGTYFNRDGFCFAIVVSAVNETAYMEVWYSNQFDQPSVGKIAVRPARGFWMGRAKIEAMTFRIENAPATFGVARVAIPIPNNLQGKRQTFEVGGSVQYPQGKGRRLRFHDGVFLRTNEAFADSFTTALTIAGAAAGVIVLSRPATVKIDLPNDIAENIPDSTTPEVTTIWQLGDPPLGNAA
jgi:hypothetical protein